MHNMTVWVIGMIPDHKQPHHYGVHDIVNITSRKFHQYTENYVTTLLVSYLSL